MGGRWALALMAGALATTASVADGEAWSDVCALVLADRASTPSRDCTSCHDGSAASTMSAGAIGMSHPVTVDYAAAETRYPGKYEPRGGLPAAVPLVNGKVECTTCHDGRASTLHHVADLPQLCTACHRL